MRLDLMKTNEIVAENEKFTREKIEFWRKFHYNESLIGHEYFIGHVKYKIYNNFTNLRIINFSFVNKM